MMNLANKLTMFRILLVPIFVIFININSSLFKTLAFLVFILASLTDFFDGQIARKRNLITTFGKFADPLADKILVCAALIELVAFGILPAWTVILIIAREFVITGFRVIAAKEDITIAASSLGKVKTMTQMVSLVILLSNYEKIMTIGLVIFYISLFFTVFSGMDYLLKNKKVLDLNNI